MKNNIKFLLIWLLCVNCNGQQKTYESSYKTFPEEVALQGENVRTDDSVFMRYPFRIRQHGEHLYILDLHGENNYFHIFDKSGNGHIASFGTRGEGPEELLQAINFRYVSPDSIWTLDSNKRQICRWKFSQPDNKVSQEEVIQLTSDLLNPLDFLLYDSATFLIPDYLGKNRLNRVNNQGEITESIGTIPARDQVKKEILPALAQAWRSFIDYNPQKHVMAIATQLGDVIEIFNQNTGTRKVLYGPYGEPKYKRTSEGYAIPTGIMGYSDIQVTDQYIYAVFHGRSFEEIIRNQGKSEDGGRYIHVFDFNGDPVCRYILDQAVYGIHVDEKNGIIWATNVNADEQILKYKIRE